MSWACLNQQRPGEGKFSKITSLSLSFLPLLPLLPPLLLHLHRRLRLLLYLLLLLSLPLLLSELHALGHLDQLGDVEAVHVVHVWVDPACLPEVDVVALLDKLDEALLADLHTRLHHLHVTLLQRVVDHLLVLEGRDRARRVDDGPAYTSAVDRGQDQLLLDVRVLVDVEEQAVSLDGVVLGNDAEAGAGSVEQDAVEGAGEDEGVFAAVAAGDHGVGDAEAVEVELEGLQALLLEVVGEDAPRVLHHLRDVGGLAARRRGHVQHALAHLRVQRQHGQEGGGALQHVVPRQVLGSGSDRHLRLVDLDSHLAPLRQRVQIGPALNEALSQFFAPRLEGVGADGERALGLVGLEKLDQFCGVEEVEEVVDELEVVAVVSVEQAAQLLDVVLAWTALAQLADVHEDIDRLLDLQVDHADVHGLVVLLLLLRGSIAVHLLIALFLLLLLPLSLNLFFFRIFLVVFLMKIFA